MKTSDMGDQNTSDGNGCEVDLEVEVWGRALCGSRTRFRLYCAPPGQSAAVTLVDAADEPVDGSVLVHEFEVPFTGELAKHLGRVGLQAFVAGADFARLVGHQ